MLVPIPSLSYVQKGIYLMGMNDENVFLNENKLINNDKIFQYFCHKKYFAVSFVLTSYHIDITNLYLTGGKHVSTSTLS